MKLNLLYFRLLDSCTQGLETDSTFMPGWKWVERWPWLSFWVVHSQGGLMQLGAITCFCIGMYTHRLQSDKGLHSL